MRWIKAHKYDITIAFNCLLIRSLIQIVLNSMHKYQPRIHLVKLRPDYHNGNPPVVNNLEYEQFRSYIYPETQFTAVTAYQNQLVSHRYYRLRITNGFLI